jgi:hypothetical protein
MSPIESLIFLLGAAALLAQLARVLRVPYPVFLVLGGLLIGFVPGLPTVEISPEVIFLVFLPTLLKYAAFFSLLRNLRRQLGLLRTRHRPRTLHHGCDSSDRPHLNRPAVGRGLRPRGNSCPNRSGGS